VKQTPGATDAVSHASQTSTGATCSKPARLGLLGLSMVGAVPAQAFNPPRPETPSSTSFSRGGLAQHDSFDLKPERPLTAFAASSARSRLVRPAIQILGTPAKAIHGAPKLVE